LALARLWPVSPSGRRPVDSSARATTLRKAIETAKAPIHEYDEAPYTAEDVAKVNAARGENSEGAP